MSIFAAIKAWGATANVRKIAYAGVVLCITFLSGFFIGSDMKEDSILIGQSKTLTRQADKTTRQVAKDSNTAIRASNRVEVKTEKLSREIQGVNDAISKAPTSTDCTLSADELREFNQAIDAANAS